MQPLTPDSLRYLADTPPSPFHLRPLLPWLCRRHLPRWQAATWLGLAALMLGTGLLAGSWQAGIAAALMAASVPMVRFNLDHPVLVDLPALGLAALAAGMWHHDLYVPAIVLVLAAGAAKETAPVFAALFAWSPFLLVGMLVPLIVKWRRTPGEDVIDEHNAWILAHPWQASKQYHAEAWRTLSPVWVAPWGALIVAVAAPSWQLAAVLVVAYAQTLIATDTVRLYQWAVPTVAVAATMAVPMAWWPVVILLTVFNPARGDGL